MMRGISVVAVLAFALSGCESYNLGSWKKVSGRTAEAPAKWVYVPSTGEVVPNAFVPPEPVAQPAPVSQPAPQPEPAPVAAAPAPQPVEQPAAVTSGGQGAPTVITCTIC